MTLWGENACGETMVEHPVTITVPVPVAILSVTYLIDGLQVAFDATVEGTAPIATTWAFGDGEGSDLEDPMHVYAEGGCYPVTLTAGNPYGPDDGWTEVICVCEPVDGVDFAWAPEVVTVGRLILFTALAPVTGTAPFAYIWDWGDGAAGVGITTTHVYAAEDSYTITLTAQNGCGEGQMAAKTIYVGGGSREWSLYLPLLVGR